MCAGGCDTVLWVRNSDTSECDVQVYHMRHVTHTNGVEETLAASQSPSDTKVMSSSDAEIIKANDGLCDECHLENAAFFLRPVGPNSAHRTSAPSHIGMNLRRPYSTIYPCSLALTGRSSRSMLRLIPILPASIPVQKLHLYMGHLDRHLTVFFSSQVRKGLFVGHFPGHYTCRC